MLGLGAPAWGVSPRYLRKTTKPAQRATGDSPGDKIAKAIARFAGSMTCLGRDPGAHAPGFMLLCALRTLTPDFRSDCLLLTAHSFHALSLLQQSSSVRREPCLPLTELLATALRAIPQRTPYG